MICQRRESFLHPPLSMQVSAEEVEREDEDDGNDNSPLNCVGSLQEQYRSV